jgi:hypothetical protein
VCPSKVICYSLQWLHRIRDIENARSRGERYQMMSWHKLDARVDWNLCLLVSQLRGIIVAVDRAAHRHTHQDLTSLYHMTNNLKDSARGSFLHTLLARRLCDRCSRRIIYYANSAHPLVVFNSVRRILIWRKIMWRS